MSISIYYPLQFHPDETFQYYEQAYRFLNGYGITPWEYIYGVRSWIIPLSIFGILEAGQLAGLDTPQTYIPLVQLVFCALSLTLPMGIYRLGQRLMPEKAAIIAFCLGAFWWHFLYLAHKPMPGILSTYTLIWVCVLLYSAPTRRNLIILGLLSGTTLVLRFQLLPVIGVLGLFGIFRLRLAIWPSVAAALAVVIFAGLLDLWTWGGFLFSFIENFRLNFTYDISSVFGVSGLEYYAGWMLVQTAGMALLALPGCVLLWKRSWPLIVAMLVGAIALHIPGHKEFRFIIWTLPFLLLAIAAALMNLRGRLEAMSRLRTALFPVVGLWTVLVGFLLVYQRGDVRTELDLRTAFLALSRESDVTGLDLLTPSSPWWSAPGYYTLGQAVPVYYWFWKNPVPEEQQQSRLGHVSHVITEAVTAHRRDTSLGSR